VDYTLDQETVERYMDYGINLVESNGDDTNTLAVPATYLINQDGKIAYRHFDVNYKERSSVDELLEVLNK